MRIAEFSHFNPFLISLSLLLVLTTVTHLWRVTRNRQDDTDPNFSQFTGASKVDIDDSGGQGQEGEQENQLDLATEKMEDQMQTFVFSATLSRDLQQNLKRRKRVKQNNSKRKGNGRPETTLGALLMSLLRIQDMFLNVSNSTIFPVFYISTDELLLKLDFRDPEPEVIDLSPEGGVVSTLKESQIECLSADKVRFVFSNHPITRTGLTFCVALGCLSILLPTPIPRPLTGVPLFHRRYTQTITPDGTSPAQSLPATLAIAAETKTQKP